MNFSKLISDMQELQSKIEVYELKNKHIDDVLVSLNKEILKLEKKLNQSDNEIDKCILNIRIFLMKDILARFNLMEYKND